MSSGAGYTCVYCGTWISGTASHWCERMHPNWNPSWVNPLPDPLFERLVLALERIADILDKR